MFLLNVRIGPRHGQYKDTTYILIYQIILYIFCRLHPTHILMDGFYAPLYKTEVTILDCINDLTE